MSKLLVSIPIILFLIFAGLTCSDPDQSVLPSETWLKPAKIHISNVNPGKSVKQSIEVHNGKDKTVEYIVYGRVPDYVEGGFLPASDNAINYVTISKNSVSVKAGETKKVDVILDIHSDCKLPDHWEFWVGIKESNTQSISTELCCRWLVSMN